MITSSVKTLEKSQIEITLTISADEVQKAYEKVLEEVVKNAEIKGFRKGKAPKDVVEKSVDPNKIYQEAFQILLPKAYHEALTKHDLHPVMDPLVDLVSPKELSAIKNGEEVVFTAKTCVKPKIDLKNYQDEIKKLKAKDAIWVPGKGDPAKKEEKKGPAFEEIIKTLLEGTEVELADILIEREANRFLSQTLDEIKKLGLTLEQYLQSTQKTAEDLKAEAARKAEADLKLEFLLSEIAREQKIEVSNDDLEKVISENKDPKAQENLRRQSYLLSSILLQQKTLDFLKNL